MNKNKWQIFAYSHLVCIAFHLLQQLFQNVYFEARNASSVLTQWVFKYVWLRMWLCVCNVYVGRVKLRVNLCTHRYYLWNQLNMRPTCVDFLSFILNFSINHLLRFYYESIYVLHTHTRHSSTFFFFLSFEIVFRMFVFVSTILHINGRYILYLYRHFGQYKLNSFVCIQWISMIYFM